MHDTIFYRTIYSEEIEKSVRFAKKNLQMGGYIYVNYVVIESVWNILQILCAELHHISRFCQLRN